MPTLLAIILLAVTAVAADPGQTHVVYRVQVKAEGPRQFHFAVEITNPNAADVVFVIPFWAPGAYRPITVGAWRGSPAWEALGEFRAVDGEGRSLEVTSDGPRRWKVATAGARWVRLDYVNRDPGTPNNNRSFLGARSGLIDGPRSWVYLEGKKDLPVHVHFDLPEGWQVGTGLDPTFDPRVFVAADYDRLVDCPTLVGAFETKVFHVRGVPHRIVVDQGTRQVNVRWEELVDMVRRIVEVYVDMFDDVPYEHYTFIYTPGGGGLEHLTSTSIGGAQSLGRPRGVMGVTAHEFFHTWNVKRLRPSRLGPFDYTGPQPVGDLWICEGITSYYTPLGLWRAGLQSDPEYLQGRAAKIGIFERNPSSRYVPPEASSRGVWDGGPTSYYLQGEVLGLAIDLAIRERSDNRWSLDDVMRHMYLRNGGYYRRGPPRPGYESKDWPQEIEALTGVDVEDLWSRHIRDSQPVDWNRYLRAAGWELELEEATIPALASPAGRAVDGGFRLSVREGDPWHRAGFRDEDLLQALNDDEAANARSLRRVTGSLRTGSEFVARVVREGEVVRVAGKVEPGTEFGLLGLEGEAPVIERVPRGTSLWTAGLRPKDRIMSLNGETLEDSASVVLALDRAVPGETVVFGLTRNEERLELRVEAAERKRRSVGKLIVLEDVDDRQRRIREGMKAGTTDRP